MTAKITVSKLKMKNLPGKKAVEQFNGREGETPTSLSKSGLTAVSPHVTTKWLSTQLDRNDAS